MYDQDKKEKQCLIDKLQIDNQVQQDQIHNLLNKDGEQLET